MFTLTTVVNLLALAISLWLGFYILTRSPHSRLSWLAAATLWSIASFFLHNVVAINLPENGMLPWLRPLVVLALPLWFHLTLMLLPGKVQWWTWTPSPTASRSVAFLAYGLAFALIAGGAIPRGLSPEAEIGTYAYLAGRASSPLYPLAVLFLILWSTMSLFNLLQGQSQAHDRELRRQFTHLLIATALASLGILYVMLGVWLRLDFPTLPGEVTLAAGVVLLGYTVARYNALIQARTIKRDFVYASLAIGLLTVFYYLATLVLYRSGQVSYLSLILVIVVAISFHALHDGIRFTLDRLFYREQFRQLRANLRALAQEAGTGETLPDQLHAILKSLCRALRIRRGFIALHKEDGFVIVATQAADTVGQTIPMSLLSATEIVDLPRPDTEDLRDVTLLAPLYAGGAQVGSLVLGPKESDRPYGAEDLELLDDLADQMATVIYNARLQEDNAQAINELVADFRERERTLQRQVQQILAERQEALRPVLEGVSEKELVSLVESGLRRLHDYPFLGEHPLAQLQVVQRQLKDRQDAFVTHIDRGKTLNEILLQALHKLRPEGAEPPPHNVPQREWHQFVILHDSYVLDQPNRDIMSRLYISEGTFNRTRRRAIRGVAKALQEMEQKTKSAA